MTTDQIEAERADFEEWYYETFCEKDLPPVAYFQAGRMNDYMSDFVGRSWSAWLARAELAHERQAEEGIEADWAAIGKRMEQAAKDGYSLSFVQCIVNETFEVWMNKHIDWRITGSSTVLAEAISMAIDKAEKGGGR